MEKFVNMLIDKHPNVLDALAECFADSFSNWYLLRISSASNGPDPGEDILSLFKCAPSDLAQRVETVALPFITCSAVLIDISNTLDTFDRHATIVSSGSVSRMISDLRTNVGA